MEENELEFLYTPLFWRSKYRVKNRMKYHVRFLSYSTSKVTKIVFYKYLGSCGSNDFDIYHKNCDEIYATIFFCFELFINKYIIFNSIYHMDDSILTVMFHVLHCLLSLTIYY